MSFCIRRTTVSYLLVSRHDIYENCSLFEPKDVQTVEIVWNRAFESQSGLRSQSRGVGGASPFSDGNWKS